MAFLGILWICLMIPFGGLYAAGLIFVGAVGAAVGSLHVLTVHVRQLVTPDPGTSQVTPKDVVEGALGGKSNPTFGYRDVAWPPYYRAQMRLDRAQANRQVLSRDLERLWAGPFLGYRDMRAWPLIALWPVTVAGGIYLVAHTVAAVIVVVLWIVVTSVGGFVIRAFADVTAGMLRLKDRWHRRYGRGKALCPYPDCYHVSDLPAFGCSGCDVVQRDLRPGKLGVWWRLCRCLRRLPTRWGPVTRQLSPYCQKCQRKLPAGTGQVANIHIPVFGGTSAGKSRFIMAATMSLQRLMEQAPAASLTAATAESEHVLEQFKGDLRRNVDTVATPVESPHGITMSLTTADGHNRKALLHFFDAAGEFSLDSRSNEELSYLESSSSLVFVLDPFSIPEVQDSVASLGNGFHLDPNASMHRPRKTYAVTVQRLQYYGLDLSRSRLAIVLSKADMLRRLPIAKDLQPDHDSISTWLEKVGLKNLMRTSAMDFGSVQCFLVSSQWASHGTDRDAVHPVRWLLDRSHVSVPCPRSSPEDS